MLEDLQAQRLLSLQSAGLEEGGQVDVCAAGQLPPEVVAHAGAGGGDVGTGKADLAPEVLAGPMIDAPSVSLGHVDQGALESQPRREERGRDSGVALGRQAEASRAAGHPECHAHRQAAILEAARRVPAFALDEDVNIEIVTERALPHDGSPAHVARIGLGGTANRQQCAVAKDPRADRASEPRPGDLALHLGNVVLDEDGLAGCGGNTSRGQRVQRSR